MIQYIDRNALAQLLLKDSKAKWSVEAALALGDFYDEWQELNGPMGLDAEEIQREIRAVWTEYDTPWEALKDRELGPDDSADLMGGHLGQVILIEGGGLLLCDW